MKHQLTGAFVLAAIAAPLVAQAEGKIYGQFNISASDVESNQTVGAPAAPGDNTMAGRFGSIVQDGQSADNNGSRLGFQGSKGQFFYAVELGLDTDGGGDGIASGLGSTRHAFVGFNSSFGTFSFGRTNTAYKLAGQRIDPFYDTSSANFVGGFSPEGASYGLSNLINGWTDNSIAYISPEIGGLTLNGGIYLNVNQGTDHDFGLGADYRLGELALSVQYLDIGVDEVFIPGTVPPSVVAGSAVVDTALQGTAQFEIAGFTLGVSYEDVDLRAGGSRAYLLGSVAFDLTDNIQFAGSYGDVDQGGGEGDGFTVGAFVDLIEDFTVYGLYSDVDLENGSENQTLSLGLKYAFEIE